MVMPLVMYEVDLPLLTAGYWEDPHNQVMVGNPFFCNYKKSEVNISLCIHSPSTLGRESSFLLSFPVDYKLRRRRRVSECTHRYKGSHRGRVNISHCHKTNNQGLILASKARTCKDSCRLYLQPLIAINNSE